MRRVLILCKSEVKNTFEQIFEVGAAGAENHLVDLFIYFIYIQGVFLDWSALKMIKCQTLRKF